VSDISEINGRRLVIDDSVRTSTEKHCFSRIDVEVGGFLLGNITDAEVSVVAAQPAETAESGQTQLTFTHEAWGEVLEKMDSEFAGLEIVGWYHSHPGFGCFLSDYDIFIQENFFSSHGQHALVIDPIAGENAIFIAASGKSKKITSGKTEAAALGENLDVLSGSEARTSLVEKQLAQKSQIRSGRSGSTFVKVFGAVLLLSVSSGIGWFVGSLQGSGSERKNANAILTEVQDQLTETQLNLATVEEQLATQSAPTQSDSQVVPQVDSQMEGAATGSDAVLAPGSRTTVEVDYQILRGDSLWLIAQRFIGDGEKYRQLLKWNPKVKETGLIPGDTIVLRVPATILSGAK
jgi:proteasome lid subunit RPN8/RPN11/LysM repeat protein